MQPLASGLTMFYKRILPGVFVAAVAFFIIDGIVEGRARTPGFFITPLVVLGMGCAVWFSALYGLVDEVTDHGAFLLVRVGRMKDRVALANIKDVKASIIFNPPVMTLTLVQPCAFGDVICFIPAGGLPFTGSGKGKLDENLLQRADAARRAPPPGAKG